MNRQDAKNAKDTNGHTAIRGRMEPDAETDALAYTVIGAALEVHRALGPGWLESAYEDAFAEELRLRAIPVSRQHQVSLMYKECVVGRGQIDFLVGNRLVVELKAIDALADIHTAQVISYLRMTGCKLGLLINFNVTLLRTGIERVVLSLS